MRNILLLISMLGLLPAGCGRTVSDTDTVSCDTFVYSVKGGDSLRLDRYTDTPAAEIDAKKPCMIFVFGGAFISGTRDAESYRPFFEYMAREQGYTVVSLAYRLGLGDDGGDLWSLRRSGDGRFVRDLHRDGVGVNRLFGCAGDAAADVRRAAVQQVRHKCEANFQLRAGSTGNIRPDVAADLDLPLIVAGQAARSERLLFIFRNGNCIHSDILAVDHKLRVRSGGGDEGGGHEAEGKSAAEKQR